MLRRSTREAILDWGKRGWQFENFKLGFRNGSFQPENKPRIWQQLIALLNEGKIEVTDSLPGRKNQPGRLFYRTIGKTN